MKQLFQKLVRQLVLHVQPTAVIRRLLLRLRGAEVGAGTVIPKGTTCTWPHQVRLGERCVLQPDVFFNYDHYWTAGPSILIGHRVFIGRGVEFNIQGRIEVGDDSLIAAGCIFVDHDHGTDPDREMKHQANRIAPIQVGRGVWLGARAVILKGVHIGDGAVVGAGSVVTVSIGSNEIWAGVPARFIRRRGGP